MNCPECGQEMEEGWVGAIGPFARVLWFKKPGFYAKGDYLTNFMWKAEDGMKGYRCYHCHLVMAHYE